VNLRTLSAAAALVLSPSALVAQNLTELTRQVFEAETRFADSMARRDFAAFSEHVADDAVFFGDRGAQRGKAAVLDAWRPHFQGPEAPFSWHPDKGS